MKQVLFIWFVLALSSLKSQSVANGDFSAGAGSWGCNPETYPENVYGGGTSNSVAEVDELAGLCQTISGFVPGSIYSISIDYSRRTGGCPGPNPAGANIIISNGVLTASVSSNVANYALQNSVFTFTATQTMLTLSIVATFVGTTCGLIIDNVVIAPYSTLPIELVSFNATTHNNSDVLDWITASQVNNDFFTVERSADAISWEKIKEVAGAGNSTQSMHYSTVINETLTGIYYYRLKQTDYNKRASYSPIVSVERVTKTHSFFPNPAKDQISLPLGIALKAISVIGTTGNEIQLDYTISDSGIQVNISLLPNGIYTLKITGPSKDSYYRMAISR